MVEQDFADLVTSLCAYFERKQPGPESLSRWFEELRRIPREALPFIKQRFCEKDEYPGNFPNAIKSLWNEWLLAHPEKRAKEKKPGCPNCQNGWLFVAYLTPTKCWGETALKCGHCNRNGDPKDVSAWTIEQVVMSGKYFRPLLCGANEYVELLPPVPEFEFIDVTQAKQEHSDLDNLVGQVIEGMAL